MERQFLEALGGDCRSAVAALATHSVHEVWMDAEILSPDGREVHRLEMEIYGSSLAGPDALAHELLSRASPGLRAMFRR